MCLIENLQNLSIDSDKIRKILELASKKGPKGYLVFKECLKNSHHMHLVELLEKTEQSFRQQQSGAVRKGISSTSRPLVKQRTPATQKMSSSQTGKPKKEKPKAHTNPVKEQIIYSRNSPVAPNATAGTTEGPGPGPTNQQSSAEGSGRNTDIC